MLMRVRGDGVCVIWLVQPALSLCVCLAPRSRYCAVNASLRSHPPLQPPCERVAAAVRRSRVRQKLGSWTRMFASYRAHDGRRLHALLSVVSPRLEGEHRGTARIEHCGRQRCRRGRRTHFSATQYSKQKRWHESPRARCQLEECCCWHGTPAVAAARTVALLAREQAQEGELFLAVHGGVCAREQ